MRIVIDLQGAQSSGSRNRGIGRYTKALVDAILRNAGEHDIYIVLNGLFPETIMPIRKYFESLLSEENICVWSAPEGVDSVSRDCSDRRRRAELIREAALANLNPDFILVTSLFEGGDDAVVSVGSLSSSVPTAVILYDLIPYIYKDIYLPNPLVMDWYQTKLNSLRRSDLVLAISESSRLEAVEIAGISPSKTVNISSAVDLSFTPLKVDAEEEKEVRSKFSLDKPFVMYTGGIDHRKNIDGLIRVYAKLPISIRKKHILAVVCSVRPEDRERLVGLALSLGLNRDELVLTGYVSDDEMLSLYRLCKAFVFPSWHEGFGLPVLEAMSCGRAVITANCSSLPEVVGLEEAMFDPRDDDEIYKKLYKVLTDNVFREKLERWGLERSKQFSWDICALNALKAMTLNASERHEGYINMPADRLRLAYVSPMPPTRSGIAHYSATLLPHLAEYYDVDVISDQECSDDWVRANASVFSPDWFKLNYKQYDRVVYHFGNSEMHLYMYDLLSEIPGVVVLHDFFLSDSLAHMDLHGISKIWSSELLASGGISALKSRSIAAELPSLIKEFPANSFVLNNAVSIIVHSEVPVRLAENWYGPGVADRWKVIPLLRNCAHRLNRIDARESLGYQHSDFVVCSFGLLGKSKLNDLLLDAWYTSELSSNSNCYLVFVGENSGGDYGASLNLKISKSSKGKRVSITGWVDDRQHEDYLAAADLCVQLRADNRGETSAAVLDCLGHGLPTIINQQGSMRDIPDDVVFKVDSVAPSELASCLERMWRDDALKERLRHKSREYVCFNHAPSLCAKKYHDAIEKSWLESQVSLRSVVNKINKISPVSSVEEKKSLSSHISCSLPSRYRFKIFFIDVSLLNENPNPVVFSAVSFLMENQQRGWVAEPICYDPLIEKFRYAREFFATLSGFTLQYLELGGPEQVVEFQCGDMYVFPSLDIRESPASNELYSRLMSYGVTFWAGEFESEDFSGSIRNRYVEQQVSKSDSVRSSVNLYRDCLKNITSFDF